VRLGGGENKNYVGRGFLQRLEKSVEGLIGKHVHFIDDVDLVFVLGGKILDILPQFPDFVDSPVGSSIDLQYVYRNPIPDFLAERAVVTGVTRGPFLTVQGFSQDSGYRGLPHPPGTGKEVGMSHPFRGNRILEGLGDGSLSDHFLKGLGTPFSGQD
jgi:hypothetical protein